MPVYDPVHKNFLYRFEGSTVYRYTDQPFAQTYGGETYEASTASHSMPTWSSNPSDAEIDVTFKEDNAVANLYLIHPPPYKVKLRIYEYDRVTGAADAHWTGYIVRPSWDLLQSTVSIRCKTPGFMLERESVSDSLSPMSRYSVFDARSGVDVEATKITVTVTAINDLRDILTVTGITQIDDWFTSGVIVAPDGDQRTVLKHVTDAGDKKLYLSAAFNSLSLDTGDTATLYAGDDLLYETWTVKYSAGQAFGGWPFTPNHDPAKSGIR
jgi:hypothetical protein